ncbi:MAG: hypothetical protein JOZ24_00920 [Candidatus Eremiobacteraeota bacterium]|nr:hypothetical protein [Candidatus Eremiobacteraeota bacterium]
MHRRFGLRGTFLPAARASDNPIAIACLRLFTRLPLPPLRARPRLNSCISLRTLSEAAGLYLRVRLFFAPLAFREGLFLRVELVMCEAVFRELVDFFRDVVFFREAAFFRDEVVLCADAFFRDEDLFLRVPADRVAIVHQPPFEGHVPMDRGVTSRPSATPRPSRAYDPHARPAPRDRLA